MRIEWSADALADLNRFAEFLQEHHPGLAAVVAREIVHRAQSLIDHPRMGRQIAGRPEYRQMSLRVLNAAYVFQYRLEAERLVMLRVYHAREHRMVEDKDR